MHRLFPAGPARASWTMNGPKTNLKLLSCRVFRPASPSGVADRAALDDVNQEQHDGDDEQDVQQAAEGRRGHHAKEPQQSADEHDGEHHTKSSARSDAESGPESLPVTSVRIRDLRGRAFAPVI